MVKYPYHGRCSLVISKSSSCHDSCHGGQLNTTASSLASLNECSYPLRFIKFINLPHNLMPPVLFSAVFLPNVHYQCSFLSASCHNCCPLQIPTDTRARFCAIREDNKPSKSTLGLRYTHPLNKKLQHVTRTRQGQHADKGGHAASRVPATS